MVYVFEEVVETERVVVTPEYEPSGFSFCCTHKQLQSVMGFKLCNDHLL